MNRKPTIILAVLVALLAALCAGCASQSKPTPTAVEDAADTWKAMEKQSQGHSPRGQFTLAEPPLVIHTPGQAAEQRNQAKPGQPTLPDTRMSLRMHNAEVSAVLQALSRAAGKSIVLSPGVKGVVNLNVLDRPWDEIFLGVLGANKLTHSFDGQIIRVMAAEDLQGVLDLETIRRKTMAERSASLKEEPLTTTMVKVRFADAKQLQKTIEATLSKDKDGKPVGNVQVDELTNALIVQSVDTDIPKLTRLMSKLDSPRAQIKLKAHIVETTKETARELGILWGGLGQTKTGGGNNSNLWIIPGGTTSDTAGKYNSLLGGGIFKQGWGINYPAETVVSSQTGTALGFAFGNANGNILEMQLQALQQEKKLNIISSPSIATMDNQKAYTEAGERVPYQSSTGTGTNITYSVNFQDAVLRLEITPHIIDDEFIRLSVLIQKDEVDTSRTVSGNPYIIKKKTETTLIARNGETVVISGLSKVRNKLNEAGTPGLMDVPGLGWLTKSQVKDEFKDEFMIFITPTVLADWKVGERQKSYEELERELKESRAAREALEQEQASRPQAAPKTEQKPAPVVERPLSSQKAAPAPVLAQKTAPPAAPAQDTLKPASDSIPADAPVVSEDPQDETSLLKARAGRPALGGRR